MTKARNQSMGMNEFTDANKKLIDELIDPTKCKRLPVQDEIQSLLMKPESKGAIYELRKQYGKICDVVFDIDANTYIGAFNAALFKKLEAYMVDTLRAMFGAYGTPEAGYRIDTTQLANALLSMTHMYKIRSVDVDKELVIYSNAKFSYVPALSKLNDMLAITIINLLNLSWRPIYETEVVAIISRLAPEYNFSADNRYSIFLNCTYDWLEKKYVPHDPGQMCLHTHPVEVKQGDYPNLKKMFEERWPNDPIVGEMLIEWLGFNLRRSFGAPFIMVWYSLGQSGKSTLINAMASIIGEEAVSHASLNQLGGEFGLSKLLTTNGSEMVMSDFADETDSNSPWPIQIIKQLSSPGSKVNVNRKNKAPINVPARTLLTQATNTIPSIKSGSLENTHGYRRRIVPIPWGAPLGAKADTDFGKRLESEYGAITYAAIEAYNRLEARDIKTFIRSPTVLKTADEWFGRVQEHPMKKFVDDFIESNDGGRVGRPAIFDEYKSWLRNANLYAANLVEPRAFWKDLQKYVSAKMNKPVEIGSGHNHVQVILDIKLNQNNGGQ